MSEHTTKSKRTKTQLINDMDMILCLLRDGRATMHPPTGEFCFNNLRYSTWEAAHTANGWSNLCDVVGRANLQAVLKPAHPPEPAK